MENLQKAIGLFIEEMRDFVVQKLDPFGKGKWSDTYYHALSEPSRNQWDSLLRSGTTPGSKVLIDYSNLPDFARNFKEELKKEFKSDAPKLGTWFIELREVRNKLQHFDFSMTPEMIDRAYLTMIQVLEAIGEKETAESLRGLRSKPSPPEPISNKTVVSSNPVSLQTQVTGDSPISKSKQNLPPWFSVVIPHLDIRKGRLDESVFAANLMEVSLGNGREVYANPILFFEKTYPTLALKSLMKRVADGLVGGDSENRVISLQTGFGGGKTHSLISLYHLVRLPESSRKQKAVQSFLVGSDSKELQFPQAKVAVFTNTTNDPKQGRTAPDGTQIHTLWGEIAYQLGGKEAYKTIAENDISKVSPKGLFSKVLERTKPALILIDELADYCLAASGVLVGGSNLSDQTISFLQELTQAVAEVPGVVLVATLPASNVELGNSENSAKILTSLESRIKRVGADQKPVDDNEIFEVIRRRLFENFDDPKVISALDSICRTYKEFYFEHASEIPDRVNKAENTALLHKSYPFHPELILAFQHKWGSHSGFQRTRGVLRILANVISDLWKRKENLLGPQAMIHAGDIRFENLNTLTSELRRLWGDGYEAVILADVSSSNAHSYRIDSENSEYGSYNIAKSISASLLLNSFGNDGANRGLTIKDIKLSVLRPEAYNHNLVNGALDKLINVSHYLYYTSEDSQTKRFWYHTKPNINILIAQTRSQISSDSVRSEIMEKLKEKVTNFPGFRALLNTDSEIPEQKSLAMVFLPPDFRANPEELPNQTKARINKLFLKRGQSDRLYRNTILFCIASDVAYPRLEDTVREYLACKKTKEDYFHQLEPDQKEEVKRRLDEFGKKFETNLLACYSLIVKPRSKEEPILLSLSNSANESWEKQFSTTLTSEGLLIDSLGLKLLEDHSLLPKDSNPISVANLYEAFLRFDDKPMIVGPQAISKTITRYVLSKDFALATKKNEQFVDFQFGITVSITEPFEEHFYLVAQNLVPSAPTPEGEKTFDSDNPEGATPTPHFPNGIPIPPGPEGGFPPISEPMMRSVEVSGKLGYMHYHQFFSSFVQNLINNSIEITIKIKGFSTPSNPLTKNSPLVKSMQESAKQLGLHIEFEE